jgi:undecaprenyl diphosphate synthase
VSGRADTPADPASDAADPTSGPVDPASDRTDPTGAVPGHVAIIMDGNGRWAESRNLPRGEGHRRGEERLADAVRAADALGIGWLTVFGFSTENWARPKLEIDTILALHKNIFARTDEMDANNVRIRCIGRPVSGTSRLPRRILRSMDKSIEQTKGNDGLNFTLAFDYGGREELVYAAKRLVDDHRRSGVAVTEQAVRDRLYEPALPPVDLLVRTSGERRLSNFLLWEAAGAPFYVTPTYWPDFDRAELEIAVDWWRQVTGVTG